MDSCPASSLPRSRWQRLAWASLLTTVSALLAIGITATNIPWASNPGGTVGRLYLAVAVPGHFLALGALAMLPALLAGLWPRSTRTLTITAVLMQGLWLCLLLLDAKVFALYRFHLNAMVLNMVFGGALQDQVSLSWSSLFQVAGLVLAVFAAQALLAWACWRLLPIRTGRRQVLAGWSLAALLMLLGQGATAYYDARGERAVVSQWAYLPWAQPITAKRQMRALGVPVIERTAALPDPGLSELAYPLAPLRCQSAHRPNVLVVVLESLRADALDARTMPHAMALAARSRVFSRHYSTGNATRFGLFGLLYGLPGGYWEPMLAEQRGALMFQVLGQQGYAMYLHGSAPLYSPEFDRTAFADVRSLLQTAPSSLDVAARDRHVIETLQAEIRATPRSTPWFGFAFLDATHAPYHLPDGYPALDEPMATDIDFLALDNEHDPTPERNRYRTSVHYADSLVGQLLQTVSEAGMGDNTIVLVTGDHAEEFNDLGLNYWGHNGNFSDYQLHVPFVLHWPGRDAVRDTRISSHEDFVPTVMRHALGCENPIGDFSTGHDLLAPAPAGSRALLVESWSQRGIRRDGTTYVFDRFGNATALGADYLPLQVQAGDAAGVRVAWDKLTRFRRR